VERECWVIGRKQGLREGGGGGSNSLRGGVDCKIDETPSSSPTLSGSFYLISIVATSEEDSSVAFTIEHDQTWRRERVFNRAIYIEINFESI